jgi:hypothetical protein
MLVKMGYADALLGGATYSTADTVRPALQIIKTKPGNKIVSSCFIMVRDSATGAREVLAMGDCAINIDPTEDEPVEIGLEAAKPSGMSGLGGSSLDHKSGLCLLLLSGSVGGGLLHHITSGVNNSSSLLNSGLVSDGLLYGLTSALGTEHISTNGSQLGKNVVLERLGHSYIGSSLLLSGSLLLAALKSASQLGNLIERLSRRVNSLVNGGAVTRSYIGTLAYAIGLGNVHNVVHLVTSIGLVRSVSGQIAIGSLVTISAGDGHSTFVSRILNTSESLFVRSRLAHGSKSALSAGLCSGEQISELSCSCTHILLS